MTKRDFAMARMAAARFQLVAAQSVLDDVIAGFIDPEIDKAGKERIEGIETVLELAGDVSRSLEAAQDAIEEFSKEDWQTGEPDLDDEEEDSDDSDDEEDAA